MLFTCVLMSLSALTALSVAEQCVKVDSCTCKTSTMEYSLHPLSSFEGPSFDAKEGNDHYYYNPCKDFSKQGAQGSQPITGVIIQYQGTSYYALGDDATAAFSGDPDLGTLKLTYTHKDPSGSTRFSVYLMVGILVGAILFFKYMRRAQRVELAPTKKYGRLVTNY